MRGERKHGTFPQLPSFLAFSRHVVLIEPVAPDSKVAQLTREFKKGSAAAAAPAANPGGAVDI